MMPKVLDISDTESLSDGEGDNGLMSRITPRPIGENGASSSGTNLRSSFIGMGFSPALIDKVIKEKGEEDADLLLDTLFAYSAHEKLNPDSSDSLGPTLDDNGSVPGCDTESNLDKDLQETKSMSSDSLDSLLDGDKDVQAGASIDFNPKQEPDLTEDPDDNKRASLLMMNFPVADVDLAITQLGKSAPIDELVDFIMAAQIAETEKNRPNDSHVNRNEDCSTEALFGTMNKTLQLLDMGFNEHEVSLAIEKLGSEVPILELANCICASQMGESYQPRAKNGSIPSKPKRSTAINGSWYHIKGMPSHCDNIFNLKTEKLDETFSSQRSSMNVGNIMPKEEYFDDPVSRDFLLDDIKGKRPKQEYEDVYNDTRKRSKTLNIGNNNNTSQQRKPSTDKFVMPPNLYNNSGRSVDKSLYEPPYFLYGNFVNLSSDGWKKVSQFLYAIQPEFVSTQQFSALNRMEGYIHNLPIEDRFHIKPKSPMTIEEVIPHTKKWWPSWDSRKQISSINSDIMGTSQICHSLEKMLSRSRGSLSSDQQTKLLYYCRTMNLIWVGNQKLGPMEPEHLERILGYPINHTRNPDMTLAERLEALKNCFQTDTLGYYLSVLKPLFPGGITLLSVYGGIGGAEVTLHRLGIYMKAVVSVESNEGRRKVLRRWWQNTDQTGELVQIENVQKLTSNRLESLVRKFGGFDLVICQNPCTYPEKGSNSGNNEVANLDFTLYYEFVRVLQRVKTMSGRT